MAGTIDVVMAGDSVGVQRMLLHMMAKLSPTNLVGFLNNKIDPYLRMRARSRFSSEGDDVVGKWASLSPFTQQIRSSQGYGGSHPINKRTGRLEAYIIGGSNQIIATPLGASLTTPGQKPTGQMLDKVLTAQEGSSGGKGQRPTVPRPVMGLNERDLLFVLTALAYEIEGQ